MATKKKMLQAAAGGAGGAGGLDITDVFSTYLYTGNDGTKSIQNGINLGDNLIGGYSEFTGASENLTKSADLTGNADSKEFTLSVWIKVDSWTTATIIKVANGYFNLKPNVNGTAQLLGANASGTYVLKIDFADGVLPEGSWFHLLVSVDLTSTSNRYVYVNNAAVSPTYTTYTNTEIDFTRTPHKIAGDTLTDVQLAHLYLDYTYRNLSTESNRLLFYNTDGAPTAGQADLNPILYLPMDGSSALGVNAGTGGDFTVTGSPSEYTIGGPGYESGSGEGGLVWIKQRDGSTQRHVLYDTERGTSKTLSTDRADAEFTSTTRVTSFNSDGFDLGSSSQVNGDPSNYASWTFRKAPKFFDVVTYTGDGVNGRTVSHNLGSVPAMMIVKGTSSATNWYVYHTDTGNGFDLFLNSTIAKNPANTWYSTDPTSTEFTLSSTRANNNGVEYVAYLFAHNDGDGEFGPDADQDIIKCGSYTGNGSSQDINLGFEAQWVMIKPASVAGNWNIMDVMRGMPTSGLEAKRLIPNTTNTELNLNSLYGTRALATGFTIFGTTLEEFNKSGEEYIYMAIRRGPLAAPTDAADVFDVNLASATATNPAVISTIPTIDMAILASKTSADKHYLASRLTQAYLRTDSTAVEGGHTATRAWKFDNQYGFYGTTGTLGTNYLAWMWKRAPHFFDVVCYEWNGTATRNVEHNLGVPPEMYIVKRRNSTTGWYVRHKDFFGTNGSIVLNTTAATAQTGIFTTGGTTDTTFPVANDGTVNASGGTYIAYLFASLDGISKVGSYTGNGSSQTINCGFTSGSRFILIKRTDSTGDWYVWDTERGIVAGNDPHLSFNTTAVEVTTDDSIDPDSSGFIVNQVSATNINVSSAEYIFYAIA